MNVGLVITAAGSGSRFGGDTPKQFLPIDGVPMIVKSCRAFDDFIMITDRVVTVSVDHFSRMEDILGAHDLLDRFRLIEGGATRCRSVENGVNSLSNCDYVMIHDAARPWVRVDLIKRLLKKASPSHGVVPGLSVSDTLKQVENGMVVGTLNRESIIRVQTPQIFPVSILLSIYRQFPKLDMTDEAGLFESAGYPVVVAEGDEGNVKVTVPSDLTY
jgi:2-C-methyl-D-erythritol 4-phosphate cytidylyltransferase